MPEVKLPEVAFTWDTVLYIVALIVAASGVLVAIVKGWEAYRKISVRDKIRAVENRCAAIEGRLTKVEARLSLGDKRFALQNDDMGAILSTQQALLMHFITGNDHAKLQTELTNLNTYINNRASRMMEYSTERDRVMNEGGQGNE